MVEISFNGNSRMHWWLWLWFIHILWKNAVGDTICEGNPWTQGPPWPPYLYPSQYSTDVHIGREWSVCRPTHVRARPPIVLVQAVSHHKIITNRALRWPLLNQGSQPMWSKTSRRPKKPPQTCVRPSPWSSFTQTHRRSHPESSREDPSGLPYRRVPKLPTRNQHLPRPPPLIPTHRQPSGVSKEIQIAQYQQMMKSCPPVRPLTLAVTSCWRPDLEGMTETLIMLNRPKTHPRSWPTRQTSRDTSEK